MSAARGARALVVVREALLTGAAVVGGALVLAIVVAVATGVTLVIFSSASMSPTIPVGSAALVRSIPPDEIRVGDIVTVDRPGDRPITHRVTSVRMVGADEAVITLRGDANSSDDAAPYRVTEVRRVLVSVEHLGAVIAGLSHPVFVGTMAVAAALLVTWAFWPARRSS